MQEVLASLIAGALAALVFYPLRLSGLAAASGFFAAVYLTGQLAFEKNLLVMALAAALLGALVDLAFRPTRTAGVVLGLAFGVAAFWVFMTVIGRMPAQRLVLYAVGITLLLAVTVALSVLSHDEPPRAGAAGVGLGVAVGTLAWHGGAKLLALWSFGLAAGAAGFLLVGVLLPRRMVAGLSLTLSVGVIGAGLATLVTLQRGLVWYHAALLALIPLAVRLPAPQGSALAQALVALIYALGIGGAVCALVWYR